MVEGPHVAFLQFPPIVTFYVIMTGRILKMSPQDLHPLIIQTLISLLLWRNYADVKKRMGRKVGTLARIVQVGVI